MATEKIYDLWANRNPQWEKRYEESIIKNFCDYGRGATSLREDRGKVFGGGYEIFIVAFFMGGLILTDNGFNLEGGKDSPMEIFQRL